VSDLSNKEAGDHFTPREVISLMVHLLVSDTDDLHTVGKVLTCYDPACGTGGMLTETEKQLLAINPKARVYLFGQEINPKSHAVCTSDMLIKGQDATNIKRLDTLANDGFPDRRFEYVIANPPYGVDWTESMVDVKREHARGFAGRFGAGLPGKGDGQFLFVQHMIAKAKTADEGGGRVAVVLNGSPMFSGDAGSGESNIRKWLFENDLVEAIIGLPDQLFYNTGIHTYVWVMTTKKRSERQGYVQLIDARDLCSKMPRSLGDKRNELTQNHISEIVRTFESFTDNEHSKVMRNEEFGYTKITIERPLRVRYELTNDTVDALRVDKALAKLVDDDRAAVIDVIAADLPWHSRIRSEADEKVATWTSRARKVPKAVRDAVMNAISIDDAEGEPVASPKGGYLPNSRLRDFEYVPLEEEIQEFIEREVLPLAPDAWHDATADRVGYEVPFTRLFFSYKAPRTLEEIDSDLDACQQRILQLIAKVKQ
jgi:type I restriction enzyme M protein